MPRVTISEPGKTPQPYRFKLERKLIKIGRGSDNDIVIACGSASTSHCVMERIDGGYIMRDLGSTNGIKQDDTLMEIIDLFDGMEVLVGDVPVMFQLSDEEIEELSEEEFTSHQKKKLPPVRDNDGNKGAHEDQPKKTSPRPSSRPTSQQSKPSVQKSGSALKTLLVFLLVIAAIFAGMTIRHNLRTGDFLPTKLMGNNNTGSAKTSVENSDEATTEASDEEATTEDTPAEEDSATEEME